MTALGGEEGGRELPKIDIDNLPVDRLSTYPMPFKAVEGRERKRIGRGRHDEVRRQYLYAEAGSLVVTTPLA